MSACFPAFRRKRTLLAESVVWDADYFFCILGTLILLSFFFFFQAEDGIRDSSVTGVQTCALPIYICPGCGPIDGRSSTPITVNGPATGANIANLPGAASYTFQVQPANANGVGVEIGRASCRERV